ncbi:Si-specific NAD(P)(+) transhydrogenase [Gemmata sp. JC673]|uniref:Soluble pyridine nucleotide transhydrogenase n=1 Tax=Gemmata algarum TaxID=2975278 RepID=A0ABU5F0J7_9BACT|nr:Si-specific NAD(P)(+) transhydrogenase [Gemmata algarum]MDY3559379.1 Si-specific NAD(P)(+) transhydrogenase [Gemmata algarum]
MPKPLQYDLIVIGAGPGGLAAADTAALLGKRVALVERNPVVGGAAVNTGTIPSKTLRETALAISGAKARAVIGLDVSVRRQAKIEDLMRHERVVKASEAHQMRTLLDRYGVMLHQGTGSFVDPHTVRVTRPSPPGGSFDIRADKIVIAIGSTPVRPAVFPFEHARVHDSDELLYITSIPRSLAVIGGGVIGSEYACMFAALGVRVHLIDGRDTLLPFLDPDLSAALTKAMERQGIVFHWKEQVERCHAPRSGEVELQLKSGNELAVSNVLVCAGRTSYADRLDPAAAGFGLTPRGLIPVDEHFRTTVPHIYAVGDVIGFPALASTSYEQGRVAACHAFGSMAKEALAQYLPAGIYTIPEVSSVGLTEPQAKEKNIPVVIGRADYDQNPRGKIIGDKTGFLKLIFDREEMKLLGVHVIGEQATELIHVGLTAMMTGGGANLFLSTCFNYPTLGDLYKLATHDAILKRSELMGKAQANLSRW